MTNAIKLCVFDAYGTLFDVHSAVRRYAASLGEKAEPFSQLWRTKQLEYSWVRSLMHRHVDFWGCTEEALDFALAIHKVENSDLRTSLLGAYRRLDAYPEAASVLIQVRKAGLSSAILSNGSPQMLADAVESAGLGGLVDAIISIEEVGIYKPDPRVYRLVTERFGVAPGEVSFQSSNAWDIAGADAFGFRTLWINRSGQPPEYGFGGRVKMLASLRPVVDLVLSRG